MVRGHLLTEVEQNIMGAYLAGGEKLPGFYVLVRRVKKFDTADIKALEKQVKLLTKFKGKLDDEDFGYNKTKKD